VGDGEIGGGIFATPGLVSREIGADDTADEDNRLTAFHEFEVTAAQAIVREHKGAAVEGCRITSSKACDLHRTQAGFQTGGFVASKAAICQKSNGSETAWDFQRLTHGSPCDAIAKRFCATGIRRR
jgi:hypothetical protein